MTGGVPDTGVVIDGERLIGSQGSQPLSFGPMIPTLFSDWPHILITCLEEIFDHMEDAK